MTEPNPHAALLNLVVVRARDLELARDFYARIGIVFTRHRHGSGPEHYASETDHGVFELYPAGEAEVDVGTRLGFLVSGLDALVDALQAMGATVRQTPRDSEWGRRAVVEDPDGRRVELVERR